MSIYRDLCNDYTRSTIKGKKIPKKKTLFLLSKLNKLPPYRWVSEVDTQCPITRSATPHYKTVIVFCSPLQLSYRALLFYTFCPARYNLDIQKKKSHKKLDPCKKSCHRKDCLQTEFPWHFFLLNMTLVILKEPPRGLDLRRTTVSFCQRTAI